MCDLFYRTDEYNPQKSYQELTRKKLEGSNFKSKGAANNDKDLLRSHPVPLTIISVHLISMLETPN